MLLFIGVFIGVFLVWPPVFIGVFLVWPPTAGWERKHPRISEVQATGRLRNWEFFASAEIPTLSNFANSLSHRLDFCARAVPDWRKPVGVEKTAYLIGRTCLRWGAN